MKKILFWEKTNEKIAQILAIWHQYSLEEKIKTVESNLYGGFVEIDNIPEPKNNDKIAELYMNTETKELFYEYKEKPLTGIEIANKRITQLENVIDEILMGGAE